MKKVTLSEPKIIAQSSEERILWGGYQIPQIRCSDGMLCVRFMGRKDSIETHGMEDLDPVYSSFDGGESWVRTDLSYWHKAASILPNGDRLSLIEEPLFTDFNEQIPILEERRLYNSAYGYTVDEINSIIGNKIPKIFRAKRIKKGETEPVEEICNINWDNMPVELFNHERQKIRRVLPATSVFKVDSEGVIWLPVYCPSVSPEGKLNSRYYCTHLLKSEDNGHNWDYVSTVVYKKEYNSPNAINVEGFNEATLEFLKDGSMIMVMRSGSINPIKQGDNYHPSPKPFIVKSTDKGKSWSVPKPFYDYGIRPRSVTMYDGTIVLISGRTGVYIRLCQDEKGEIWDDIIELVHVPEEDYYKAYFEYTCSNTDICQYNENTLFVAYSNFQLNDENGKRAKSILVSKITIE